MESILTSIKKLLLIDEEYTQFDPDIIIHINRAFATLKQLGVGPSTGFYIEDDTAEWTDFIPDLYKVQSVKQYVYLKVKVVFDPGSLGSATLASYEREIAELEWRLNVDAETETISTPNDPVNVSHTHGNKAVLDSYNKSQSELLATAKSEAEKLVAELKSEVENKVDKDMEMTAEDVNNLFRKP